MYLEAVLRILLRVLLHQAVTGDLRKDRRRCDAGGQAVALDDGAYRKAEVRRAVAIDQRQLRGRIELRNGLRHRAEGRLQNVDLVDRFFVHQRNAIAHGGGGDDIEQLPPLFVGQLF